MIDSVIIKEDTVLDELVGKIVTDVHCNFVAYECGTEKKLRNILFFTNASNYRIFRLYLNMEINWFQPIEGKDNLIDSKVISVIGKKYFRENGTISESIEITTDKGTCNINWEHLNEQSGEVEWH